VRWSVKQVDILDQPADVLICSANPWLNLSGGVGAAFRERYGDEMQQKLHRYLAEHGLRQVPAGSAIVIEPCGAPYLGVIHAVGIDVFYQSSVELIATSITNSLAAAAELGARTVALAAIGTGYGRMPLEGFASAVLLVQKQDFPPLEEVVICLRKKADVDALQRAIELN
jgi:O-acetyl-ADP-ribose deacetylase (regulator of RNase III)